MDKMDDSKKQHALLSASGSHRWLNCPPSARLEAEFPDEGSDFAKEGSLAHAIAAKKLKERLGQPTFAETAEIRKLSKDILPTGEMEEFTDEYVEFVMNRYSEAVRETAEGKLKPQLSIEKILDYSDYVPEGFGTGDAVIVSNGTVEVIDFKYGKGVKVSAEDNTQMKLYALGAIGFFDYCYPFDTVRMTIYQPRISNISSHEISVGELEQWAKNEVEPLARLAWAGKGSRQSGDWCRFCKVKGNCPRLTADSLVSYFINPNAEIVKPSEIGGLLGMMPTIKDWMKAIEDRSLEMAMGGTEIPGYKIVAGRSVRKIKDARMVAAALGMAGGTAEMIFKPRELKTLTELEKIFGKKEFARVCGAYIEKPEGKPTLVPVSDEREIFNNNDFKDLKL